MNFVDPSGHCWEKYGIKDVYETYTTMYSGYRNNYEDDYFTHKVLFRSVYGSVPMTQMEVTTKYCTREKEHKAAYEKNLANHWWAILGVTWTKNSSILVNHVEYGKDITFGLVSISSTTTLITSKVNGVKSQLINLDFFSSSSANKKIVEGSVGIGLKLFNSIGAKVSLRILGFDAEISLSINDITVFLKAKINLIKDSSISVGYTKDLGYGNKIKYEYSINGNTAFAIGLALAVFGFVTSMGDSSNNGPVYA